MDFAQFIEESGRIFSVAWVFIIILIKWFLLNL